MSKIGLFSVILLISGCIFDRTKYEEKLESFEIRNQDTLVYSLGYFGDEDGSGITKQASNYSFSFIESDSISSEYRFKYKTIDGYFGKDYVEIESNWGSDGTGGSPSLVLTTKITIIVKP